MKRSGEAARAGRPLWVALAVGAIAALGIVTGPELRTRALYFLPVLLAAWYDGAAAGELAGLAACAAWLFTQLVIHDGRLDVVGPPLLSALVFAATLCAASVLAARAHRSAALEQARARRRGRLMSVASHEVGNALTVMEGVSLLLKERMPQGDRRAVEWLGMLERAVGRVRAVDRRLLRRGSDRPSFRRRSARA